MVGRGWARAASAFVAGLVALVLLGYVTHIEGLTTFMQGERATSPDDALGLLLGAASVWGLTSKHAAAQHVGRALACLAGLTIAWAFASLPAAGAAEFFARSAGGELPPPRLALGLLLACVSLLLAQSKSPAWLRLFDVSALLTLLLGLLGTLSCLLAGPEDRALVPIALPSGLSITGLGISIAALQPERGWLRSVRGRGPGGVMLRQLLPAAMGFLLVLEVLRRMSDEHGWLPGYGSAPFVLASLAGIAGLVMLSARAVRIASEQREAAQRALEKESRAHASLLMERELRFRLLAETAPQVVWTAGPDGAIEYLSPAWSHFTGEPEECAQGWLWDSYIHRDDLALVLNTWHAALESGKPYETEYRVRRHDGEYRWFISRATPARDPENGVLRWYGADTEIHELREAREALSMSNARFQVALQDRDFFVFTQDLDLRYTWVHNQDGSHTDPLGKNEYEVIENAEDALRVSEIKRRVLESGDPYSGHVVVHRNGEPRFFELRANPLRDARGRIHGLAGATYDVTRSKRSDEALRDAQRLKSIAQLAAGVAHDFNNILTAIIGNASLALSALPQGAPERTRPLLQQVIESGESAAMLTRQLLAYAGEGRFQVEPTNLRRFDESMFARLRESLPSGVDLTFALPAELPLVEADGSQLQQLITNLLTNGVEAVGEGPGRIHLSMRVVSLHEASARAFDVQHPTCERYVQIEVRDDGPGMDRETLRRAFEPFFSTKFVGRGLGLSAAQGIARAHGGGIVAESQAGSGTRITVTLPCLADLSPALPALTSRSTAPTRAVAEAGVLFVDDEPSLRELSKLAMNDAGYNVWLAKNGLEALEIVRAHGDEIDVIVLDMTMPVMGGAEAARQLHAEQVTIPIIASSGYSEVETLERFGGVAPLFLPKPYRPDDLLAKVALALEL